MLFQDLKSMNHEVAPPFLIKVVHTWESGGSPYWQSITKQTLSHLNGNLKAIETSCLRNLDFLAKALNQVFIHNAIASSEESKNMLDEIPFIILSRTENKKKWSDCSHEILWSAPLVMNGNLWHRACWKFFQGTRTRALQLQSKKKIKISP